MKKDDMLCITVIPDYLQEREACYWVDKLIIRKDTCLSAISISLDSHVFVRNHIIYGRALKID